MKSIAVVAAALLLAGPALAQEDEIGLSPELRKQGEAALASAASFLKSRRNEDGSWSGPDGNKHPAITALCLAGILRASPGGETADGEFARKSLEYLLAVQKEDGGIYETGLRTYETSLSILGLVEAKNHTGDEEFAKRLDAAIAKARDYLVHLQADEEEGVQPSDPSYGGIGYEGKMHTDLSNTQTVLEALDAAGLPKDHPFYEKARTFIGRCQNFKEANDQAWAGNDAGFVYSPGVSKAGEVERPDGTKGLRSYGSMTYAGLKSYIHAGLTPKDPRVKAAYDWITSHYSIDENPEMGMQGYFYYLHTFAKTFSVLGMDAVEDSEGVVHDWRSELCEKLVELQTKEGEDAGSWVNETDRWWEGDPVLVTSYVIHALEYALEGDG